MENFFDISYKVLMALFAVIANRKILKIYAIKISKHRWFRPFNNGVAIVTSTFIVVSYFITAMLFWIVKFNSSVSGFYICITALIPIIVFALYFYRINYMPKQII